jgi:hypothetical protein
MNLFNKYYSKNKETNESNIRIYLKNVKIQNNGRITKSKILRNRRFGDLKLGYFSDSGYRNLDYNNDV